MADYGKQKSSKPPRNGPPHREHNAPGGPANPFGPRPGKAELLERLKANARKGQAEGPESAVEPGPDASEAQPEVRPEVRPEGSA